MSLPFSTTNFIFVTEPSAASASTVVFGEPSTTSAYFGIAGTLPAWRSASTFSFPFLIRPARRSSGAIAGEADAFGTARVGEAEAFGSVWPGSAAAAASNADTNPTLTRSMELEIYDCSE
jgi:hypothetical protein